MAPRNPLTWWTICLPLLETAILFMAAGALEGRSHRAPAFMPRINSPTQFEKRDEQVDKSQDEDGGTVHNSEDTTTQALKAAGWACLSFMLVAILAGLVVKRIRVQQL
ncbi:hypothetical protein MKZ38_006422 [Zalerion maritima]|uniref:Uncharacterized protein n=1 Tax=Zalerion maritima TaxID=339359 RepID=A0AAD5WQA9_9PEZI|nr:hypothetical protein MKZ38_006422 [Zalerion maritima]